MEPNGQNCSADNIATVDLNVEVSSNNVAMDGSRTYGGRMDKLRKAMDKTTEHCLSLLRSVHYRCNDFCIATLTQRSVSVVQSSMRIIGYSSRET